MICWKKDPEGRWKKRRKEKGRRMKDYGLGRRKVEGKRHWEGSSKNEAGRNKEE